MTGIVFPNPGGALTTQNTVTQLVFTRDINTLMALFHVSHLIKKLMT